MWQGLVDAPPPPDRPFDHGPIYQEQDHGCLLVQGRLGPEGGPCQVVLEVQPGVLDGFREEGQAVLVVAMPAEVGESACPMASQVIHEWSGHGRMVPLGLSARLPDQ
jgi:hypothetical protein